MSPELSIVVIVYRMARQAANTLYTLSAAYQREVSASDYEVVVVENASDENLDEASVGSLEGQFRYVRRDEAGVSPAAAINLGLSLARGRSIGLMIDGARMVSPRVVRYALDGFRLSRGALVAVPGYHLGPDEQHRHRDAQYDEQVERALLSSVDWRADGYRLFDMACPSGANPHGVFHPFLESNCMFASSEAFQEIGGADERFDLPGGGSLNLYMYRSLGLLTGSRLLVPPGEGSFHQFHGGVTTAHSRDREAFLAKEKRQLEEIWGGDFHALRREAVMLGEITTRAMPFLQWSAGWGIKRHRRIRGNRGVEWPDEPPRPTAGRSAGVSGSPEEVGRP